MCEGIDIGKNYKHSLQPPIRIHGSSVCLLSLRTPFERSKPKYTPNTPKMERATRFERAGTVTRNPHSETAWFLGEDFDRPGELD